MWPFPKSCAPESGLVYTVEELKTEIENFKTTLSILYGQNEMLIKELKAVQSNVLTRIQMDAELAEQRYNNLCRVLDIIVLESRDNMKHLEEQHKTTTLTTQQIEERLLS